MGKHNTKKSEKTINTIKHNKHKTLYLVAASAHPCIQYTPVLELYHPAILDGGQFLI